MREGLLHRSQRSPSPPNPAFRGVGTHFGRAGIDTDRCREQSQATVHAPTLPATFKHGIIGGGGQIKDPPPTPHPLSVRLSLSLSLYLSPLFLSRSFFPLSFFLFLFMLSLRTTWPSTSRETLTPVPVLKPDDLVCTGLLEGTAPFPAQGYLDHKKPPPPPKNRSTP